MATLRLVALLASLALAAACYHQDSGYYATLPEPVEVAGPPSGEIDPQWQAGYVDDNASGAITASVSVSADPEDPGYVTGTCTNGEIDATLAGYGEWIYVEGYGEVWRPYTTVVGVDFTPYETCGSWVWTDYGWTFACEWDWGWLPFHYGRWGWFDDYWAWQPGYEWSPAWVEWRGGGGYVGWRPQGPLVRDHRSSTSGGSGGAVAGGNWGNARDHRGDGWGNARDHRGGGHQGPIVRDHRSESRRSAKLKAWQWRFAAAGDFGKPRIRAHLFKSPAEGLRVTSLVKQPPVRATVQPVKAESIMRARLAVAARLAAGEAPVRDRFAPNPGSRLVQPGRAIDAAPRRPARSAIDASRDSSSVYAPTYQPPRRPAWSDRANATPSTAPNQELGGLPVQATTPTPSPSDHVRAPIDPAPTQPSYEPPAPQPPRAPTVTAPTPPNRAPDRPTYTPPRAPTVTAPTPPTRAPDRPTYTPPSRPTSPPPSYSPPSRPSSSSYSPPSRPSSPPPSYSPPSRPSSPPPSYSPPSRSSSSSSYSPPSRSSSSSYSPPSRSSSPSYSAPSRSSSPPPPSSGGSRRR